MLYFQLPLVNSVRSVFPNTAFRLSSSGCFRRLSPRSLGWNFQILLGSSFSLLDAGEGFTVYSRRSLVRFDKSVGVVQDVQPVYLVIEKIESVLLLLLGLPV